MEVFLERLVEIFDTDTLESISGPTSLTGGLILGLIFGVVLQKGRICKYDVVSGLFRLQDFTIFRLGTPLLMVSVVLIYFFADLGTIDLHIPKTVILPQIVGGLLFGAAIAILGYCPGTAAGAVGEGSLDGIPGILGMIAGAVLYAELFYEDWSKSFQTIGDIGRVTFPDILGINHWFIIVLFLLMMAMFLVMMTMMDWFIIFLRKFFNYFMDFTEGLEKNVPSGLNQPASKTDPKEEERIAKEQIDYHPEVVQKETEIIQKSDNDTKKINIAPIQTDEQIIEAPQPEKTSQQSANNNTSQALPHTDPDKSQEKEKP